MHYQSSFRRPNLQWNDPWLPVSTILNASITKITIDKTIAPSDDHLFFPLNVPNYRYGRYQILLYWHIYLYSTDNNNDNYYCRNVIVHLFYQHHLWNLCVLTNFWTEFKKRMIVVTNVWKLFTRVNNIQGEYFFQFIVIRDT